MDHARVTLFAGHYGSGKTNIAVNYALALRREVQRVTIADLDTVNPYFRTKDSERELQAAGVSLICSDYANTNLDMPALPQSLYAILDDTQTSVVVDIGGDDRGAYALGRFAGGILQEHDYEMLLVFNPYRPLTRTPAAAVEIDAGEVPMGDAVSVQTVTDWSQISAVINDYWQDDYFGEITVDPEKNRAELDGEKISLQKELDVSRAVASDIMDSSDAAEQYFEENTDYTSFTDGGGVVHVRDPYQTQRLLVYADELTGDYGASEILHWAEYGEFFLQFDSREATQAAYEQLTAELGDDNCFTDDVLTTDMLLSEDSTDSDSTQCVSWGTSYMGLDVLKEDVENDRDVTGTVTAAVIDTGIDTDHEMFEGRTVTGYNFATKDGTTAENYEDTAKKQKGHGTHVAGIVTDCTPDNVQLLILRVFDKEGEALNSAVEAAIRYAGENGADVVNMSLGSVQNPQKPYSVWDRALSGLYDENIAVFAAAGNEGEDHDKWGYSMNYPGVLDTTIAISALSKTGKLASYSSFGDTVEFAAPGSDIMSAARGGGLRSDSGTSMATPHMTGAGAYIKLLHPNCTVEDVRETLQLYAEDLGEVGRDDQYGYGAVHMENYLADSKSGTNFSIPGTVSL